MRQFIALGSTPTEETPDKYNRKQNLIECHAFKAMMLDLARMNWFGNPKSTCFSVKMVGAYYQVVVEFDDAKDGEHAFALSASGNIPTHWSEFAKTLLKEDPDKVIQRVPIYKSYKINRRYL